MERGSVAKIVALKRELTLEFHMNTTTVTFAHQYRYSSVIAPHYKFMLCTAFYGSEIPFTRVFSMSVWESELSTGTYVDTISALPGGTLEISIERSARIQEISTLHLRVFLSRLR